LIAKSSGFVDLSGPHGFIKKSVLSNVRCKYIEAEDCVLINVTAEKIFAKPGSIIYNVLDDSNLPSLINEGSMQLNEKEVVVGVFNSDGEQLLIKSHTDIDGGMRFCMILFSLSDECLIVLILHVQIGKAWEVQVAGNDLSFEEVHIRNAEACPITLEKAIADSHQTVWDRISTTNNL
jgi:hypothetical protein